MTLFLHKFCYPLLFVLIIAGSAVSVNFVQAQTAGPIGHWAFDEGSGATAGDSSGNNLNGAISGATWTAGKIGSGALNFSGAGSGAGSYVNVGSPALLTNVNTFTWSAWVKTNGTLTAQVNPIIEKGSGSNILKDFYFTNTGAVVASIDATPPYYSSSDAESDSVANTYTPGVWEYWTVTYNDTGDRKLHIYKNGVEVSYALQTPASAALVDDTGYNMYFGATPDTVYYAFNGSIDDVRIYNRVLSSAEIQSLATGGSISGGTPDTTAPSTPTGLSATALSSSQVNLSWAASVDNVGVTGYRIYRNGTQITTVTGTSYSNTGLTASTLYSYTVAAYDAAGNTSTQSSAASATTQSPPAPTPDTIAPSTPAGLSASTVSSSQINLSWTASTDNVGVTGYRIYRNGTLLTTTTGTSYSNTGLAASTAYSYTVQAYDAAGNLSGQSTAASATTQGTPSAPPPTTSSGGPVVLYTDIITGPNTGGENNDGAYLTIFGKGFGSSQGSSYVTINNVPVAVYKQWYDNKITVQPGPSVTSGPIRVIVGGVSSNSDQTFTVVPGKIFFVALNGNDSTGVIGDITRPFRNIQNTFNRSDFGPGDSIVVRGGNWSDEYAQYGSFFSIVHKSGTAGAPMIIMGYPTETVNLVRTTQSRGIHSWDTLGHYVIANFHISQGGVALGIGITPGATDVRIVNNEVKNGYEDSGGAGYIDGSGTNFRILGNLVHDNGGSKLYHGMYFDARANPAGDIEIAYNTIYNQTGGRGIQIYGDTGTIINNVRIHDNVVHDIHLDGILLGSYSGAGDQVYNNVVYNTSNAAFQGPSNDAGSGGSCLRFNSSSLTVSVYNNTFYNCAMDNGPYSTGIEAQALGSASFANNIIDTSGGLGYADTSSIQTSIITATNNLWYGSGAAPSWSANSVNADPSFVNASGANFHLTSSSPAIDKGSSLASSLVTRDYDGVSRPQGAGYDIGAYEYASGSSTTPPPTTPAPTLSFSASPASVTSGGGSTLSWSSSNATSCSASGAWSGAKATSGSQSLAALTTTGTYTLSCTGSGGAATQSVTITVTATADTTAPSTPAGLSASTVSSSQINLSWTASTDNVGVTGYRIYRNGTLLTTTTGTSYSNTGLAASTLYSYTVQAYDAAGNSSAQSTSVSATTQGTAPVSTKFSLNDRVQVSSGPLNVRSTPSTTGTLLGTAATGALGTIIGGPIASGGYNWWNVNYDNGLSGWSAEDYLVKYTAPTSNSCLTSSTTWQNTSFTTQAGTFTAAFDATVNGAAIDGTTGLSFGAAAAYASLGVIVRFNSSGFIDARNGGSYASAAAVPYTAGATYHFRLVVNVPTHTYSVYVTPSGSSEITLGTNYAFRTEQNTVSSLNNWSLYEDIASSGTHTVCNFAVTGAAAADVTPPAISITSPTIYATYAATLPSLALGGSASDNVGVTSVTWSNAQGGQGTAVGTATWNVANIPLQNGANTITVTAHDAAGNTGTDILTVTYIPVTVDTTPPGIPTNLSGSAASAAQANLSWTASTDNVGVTGYKIYRNGTQVATTTTTSYSDPNLSPLTTYTYTVSAYDSAGNISPLSSPVALTTQSQTTAPPASSGGSASSGASSGGGGGGGGGSSGSSSAGSSTGSGIAGGSSGGSTSSAGSSSSVPPPSRPSGLTSAQIQAILSLLSSFGADSATVANVSAILSGTTPPATAPQAAPQAALQTNLYPGLRTTQVTALQQLLIKFGFLLPSYATGYYGPLTTRAVQAFQAKYGIVSSGTPATTGYGAVGPKTRAKLNALAGQ